MKKVILICIALIAMFAVNAGAVSYHQSDQLPTCTVTQLHADVMPVNFTMVSPKATPVVYSTNEQHMIKSVDIAMQFQPAAYCLIDPGRCIQVSNSNNLNSNLAKRYNNKITSTARHV